MEHEAAVGLNGPAARAPVSPAFVAYDPTDVTQPLAWRFEQCARTSPAHIALQGERPVSYAELNAAANDLAALLLDHPTAGNAPVAHLMPQALEALVALLACLKAGIPFAALDPSTPAERLRALLASIGSALILCDHARLPGARAVCGAGSAVLDIEALPSCAAPNPERPIPPGERAVVRTGLAVAIPEGYAGFVQARSGRAAREGLGVLNAPGLVDSGYRGEIKIVAVNLDPTMPIEIAHEPTAPSAAAEAALCHLDAFACPVCRGRLRIVAHRASPMPTRPNRRARTPQGD